MDQFPVTDEVWTRKPGPKISKALRKELMSALGHAKRAAAYLRKPTVELCLHSRGSTTTEYVALSTEDLRKSVNTKYCQSVHLQPVEKEIGSDMAGLSFCIEQLTRLLETP